MPAFWNILGLDALASQLNNIEKKIDQLVAGQARGKELIMAEMEEITNLTAKVEANRSAIDSAKIGFDGMAKMISDLTTKLQDAIAAGGTDVSPQIKAAADALEAQTEALTAAIPKLATAVGKNVAGVR
jgi:chromosome segregation ATPase